MNYERRPVSWLGCRSGVIPEEEAPWLPSQSAQEGVNLYLPEAPWLESHCEREGVK